MPFTPFHFGPGLLVKAAAPRQISLAGFAAANGLIDLESGFNLLTGRWPVHRGLHTIFLGTVAGALAGCAAHMLARRMPLRPKSLAADLALGPALMGGILGGFSHVVLDGVTHADLRPLRRLGEGNPLLDVIDSPDVYFLCVVTGALGLAWLAARGMFHVRRAG